MKALLVDGLNLVRRIHAAVPGARKNEATAASDSHRPQDRSGNIDAAQNSDIEGIVRSIVHSLERALKHHAPSHCLVVLEHSGKNWRHRLFPDYKKKRPPVPDDLQAIIARFTASLSGIGVTSFSLMGYEADDVIATMATRIAQHHGNVTILSTDRNYCQLLNQFIRVYDHFGQRYLDAEMVQDRIKLTVADERAVQDQDLGLAAVFFQHVLEVSEPCLQAHHAVFA